MDIEECIQWLLKGSRIFGEYFYAALFERHPPLKEFFQGADMKQQSVLLTMQLTVIGQCHSGTLPAVDAYLQNLGIAHKRRGIPIEAYQGFRDVLLETLEQFLGPLWEDDLSSQWSDAINAASQKMLEGYEKDFHV